MAIAPEQLGIGLRRFFTTAGVHPYDTVTWERRDARISNWKTGEVAFEQLGVEVPSTWSVNATNILAQKYFRGTLGTPERETSLKQVVDRIVDTITEWGRKDGYFVNDDETDTFQAELKHLLINQKAAFNSPVWFNIGVEGVPQQGSACFILSVEDQMRSILNWYTEEGTIFKGGSGAGLNISKIRSSRELLQGGGTASGPVSFMRGADASAGTIKSGGKTRRAAKMVILDVNHPDIQDFIWCKTVEERKARVLRDAGFDMDLDGKDSHSIQYQNANNSVRVTDEFMQAVIDGADWNLTAVTDGSIIETLPARDLFRQISQAAWECADPGMQFDTTINKWHTAHATGRINGSNPCFTGDTLIHTDRGLVRFRELISRANSGESFQVYTHDVTNPDAPVEAMLLTSPETIAITGYNPIVRLRFANGMELRCTPNHKIFTTNRGYVPAEELTAEDRIKTLDLPAPSVNASYSLPVSSDVDDYKVKGDHSTELMFPSEWSGDFAHYLGWLIGDGSTSGANIATVYGSADDRSDVMPGHLELLTSLNGGRSPKTSEQANGTAQLRMSRRPFKAFLNALGVSNETATAKTVPWSIEQAPADVVAAFLRGLFDADGTAVHNSAKGSYVGLGSVSVDLLRGVQRLLTTFGISSRVYNTKPASDDGYAHRSADGSVTHYAQSAAYDLRITAGSLRRFAAEIGFSVSSKRERLAEIVTSHEVYNVDVTTTLEARTDEGYELTYNLSEPRNHSYVANGVVVKNCSEYMHLDNSACNLASLNLLTFLDDQDVFDVEGFKAATSVVFTAQEIIVGNGDYPTAKIAKTTRRFRQLGIGYANLGALLMAQGLAYDSDGGRAWAGAITALLTGQSYATSARTAARMGPFAGFQENRVHMLNVLGMHRDAVNEIDEELVPVEILEAARQSWDEACNLGEVHGVRNSQASVLAPTGTIGLLMDCDTTGIEPDLGLVKMKKLVGGGTMSIVNQTVPRGLSKLGYSDQQIAEIQAYIETEKSILGAPHLSPSHYDVFACSMGDHTIHYRGHIKMMAAAQPFLSGAISKTVNMPEDVTVEEVEQLHIESWQLGLKAVAIYRDNCKVGQPLSTAKKGQGANGFDVSIDTAASVEGSGGADGAPVDAALAARVAELESEIERHVIFTKQPVRERMPNKRRSMTTKFRVADCEGYFTVGEYDDGRPGEVFISVSKQGSTLSGLMDAFAVSISLGLQHGVPLSTYVKKYANSRFEPSGMTEDPELRIASSLMDYIFRRIAVDYMPLAERAELGILTQQERIEPTLPGIEEATTVDHRSDAVAQVTLDLEHGHATPAPAPKPAPAPVEPPKMSAPQKNEVVAPLCYSCGNEMQRAGSCYVCSSCGSTSGCS